MPEKTGSEHRRGSGHGGARGRVCICPNCGYEGRTSPEVPCYARKCPRCGAPMAEF